MRMIEQIAAKMAVDMKASGIMDPGCLWNESDHGHLNDAEWEKVCEISHILYPNARVSEKTALAWAQADREVSAPEGLHGSLAQ